MGNQLYIKANNSKIFKQSTKVTLLLKPTRTETIELTAFSDELTSASASASRALWSPKLACRVVLGEERWEWLSTNAFLSGWLMQPALPNVVRCLFSGLSVWPLLKAILCGLQGRGITLGGWLAALVGLRLSAPFLWRGTAAPSDRTLILKRGGEMNILKVCCLNKCCLLWSLKSPHLPNAAPKRFSGVCSQGEWRSFLDKFLSLRCSPLVASPSVL